MKLKILFFSLSAMLFFSVVLTMGLSIDWGNFYSIFWFACFQVIWWGISYDFIEIIFALILKKQDLPFLDSVLQPPKVALLYTTCDDAIEECLNQLNNQTYENYDIFILDDSKSKKYKTLINQSGYQVIRRNSNKNFKAGNLNHWLFKYSSPYQYFIILDSDSKLDRDFIEKMVKYAEHPANKLIPIFQSKIIPWNNTGRFAQTIGLLAQTRMYILERIVNRLENLISFGHNNLLRTEVIRAVGGFTVQLTPEDTAVTLTLSGLNLKCKLVDIVSSDSEPSNIFVYTKRCIRWGKQTIEVFRFPWYKSSFILKFTILRQLYSYFISILYPIFLLTSVFNTNLNIKKLIFYLDYLFDNQLYFSLFLLVLPLIIMFSNLMLYATIARRNRVGIRDFSKYLVLSISALHFYWFPLCIEMIKSIFGGKTKFIPTNSLHKASRISFFPLLIKMKASLFLSMVVIAGSIINPTIILMNMNFIWISFLLSSPFFLLYFHRNPQLGLDNSFTPTIQERS